MYHKKIVEDTNKRYNINFNKSDNLDLSKFNEVTNKKGRKQRVCDVVILYPDELQKLEDENNALKEENQSIKTNLEELNHKIKEQQKQIETLQETNDKLTSANVHQTNQEVEHQKEISQLKEQQHQEQDNLKEEYQEEIGKLKEEIGKLKEEIGKLKEAHLKTLMQKQAEYNKKLKKINGVFTALRVKDRDKMDTMIAELNSLTLMQRIRRKHFNKILNEMMEHKKKMLPVPDLEEEAHQL